MTNFILLFCFLGFHAGLDLSSFLVERLDSLSIRVSRLEFDLREERRKRMHFEGMVSVYGCEFQKLLKAKREQDIILANVKNWGLTLNKMV